MSRASKIATERRKMKTISELRILRQRLTAGSEADQHIAWLEYTAAMDEAAPHLFDIAAAAKKQAFDGCECACESCRELYRTIADSGLFDVSDSLR